MLKKAANFYFHFSSSSFLMFHYPISAHVLMSSVAGVDTAQLSIMFASLHVTEGTAWVIYHYSICLWLMSVNRDIMETVRVNCLWRVPTDCSVWISLSWVGLSKVSLFWVRIMGFNTTISLGWVFFWLTRCLTSWIRARDVLPAISMTGWQSVGLVYSV